MIPDLPLQQVKHSDLKIILQPLTLNKLEHNVVKLLIDRVITSVLCNRQLRLHFLVSLAPACFSYLLPLTGGRDLHLVNLNLLIKVLS